MFAAVMPALRVAAPYIAKGSVEAARVIGTTTAITYGFERVVRIGRVHKKGETKMVYIRKEGSVAKEAAVEAVKWSVAPAVLWGAAKAVAPVAPYASVALNVAGWAVCVGQVVYVSTHREELAAKQAAKYKAKAAKADAKVRSFQINITTPVAKTEPTAEAKSTETKPTTKAKPVVPPVMVSGEHLTPNSTIKKNPTNKEFEEIVKSMTEDDIKVTVELDPALFTRFPAKSGRELGAKVGADLSAAQLLEFRKQLQSELAAAKVASNKVNQVLTGFDRGVETTAKS